jgi:hypothetical protein
MLVNSLVFTSYFVCVYELPKQVAVCVSLLEKIIQGIPECGFVSGRLLASYNRSQGGEVVRCTMSFSNANL